jgi:histidinol-phosphate aminotransferase
MATVIDRRGVPAEKPWLAVIEAKIAGTSDRPAWAIGAEAGSVLLLDRNENRDPVLAQFLRELIAALPTSVITDYGNAEPLREKLAAGLGVDAGQVMLAPGSEASIRDVFATFVEAGDAVVAPVPTYIMVPVYCRQFGAELAGVDYRRGAVGPLLDVDAFCRAISGRRPRLVYLPNPNSPTGTVLVEPDLRRIIEAAAAVGAACLVDEAYYPFHDFTVVPWLAEHPNLLVARTFSKAWGMAGLRLGMLIGGPSIMSVMAKLKPLNEAGALTIAVAERLADHGDQIAASVRRLAEGKASFCTAMERLGLTVYRGFGNFCIVDFGEADERVMQAIERVAVFRRVGHPCMAGMQRVTATTTDLFAPLIERIQAAIGNRSRSAIPAPPRSCL